MEEGEEESRVAKDDVNTLEQQEALISPLSTPITQSHDRSDKSKRDIESI
jgi:hypothetical protein